MNNMAAKKETKKVIEYLVKVKGNPDFCGIGAGGVQFANGQAKVTSERMAVWFREHKGYEVIMDGEETPMDGKME